MPNPNIAHIYIERAAQRYPLTKRIIALYPHAQRIIIERYTHIFNRKKQNFQIQKAHAALILAVAKKSLLYRGGDRINSFGNSAVYYTDQIRNCLFNCSYCFLQGMHRTAHMLLFVNEHDFHDAVAQQLQDDSSLYVSISYLSDLLGFEHIAPLCNGWIELARKHSGLHIEIRTKSNNVRALHTIAAQQNVRLVWSLSPRAIAQQYEHGAASLPNRLLAARWAIDHGWKINLCFDPIIVSHRWKMMYEELLDEVFQRLPSSAIEHISFGTFRMHTSYFKRMRATQPHNRILYDAYQEQGGLVAPKQEIVDDIQGTMYTLIGAHFPKERIHFVHG